MIVTWSEGDADDNMPEEILVRLGAIIRKHPWWLARARLAVELLKQKGVLPPAKILDAGCGWGVTLEHLEKAGYRAAGLDISRGALLKLDRPDRTLYVHDLLKLPPENAERFEAVLALDVIEHIDDDRAAVRALSEFLSERGVLVVSVPALPELFSEFDAIQGHRRRYTLETLRGACDNPGASLESTFWWGQWMVPLLRCSRHKTIRGKNRSPAETYAEYLKLPPWPAPALISLVFRMEQDRALAGRTTHGTSLFAVLRRSPVQER